MVHRGFCGVNSLSTSQALSRVVEVAQGVFLTTTFGFDFEVKERPPILTDRSRWLDFALPVIDTVLVGFIILTSHHFCNPHLKLATRLLANPREGDFESSSPNPLEIG